MLSSRSALSSLTPLCVVDGDGFALVDLVEVRSEEVLGASTNSFESAISGSSEGAGDDFLDLGIMSPRVAMLFVLFYVRVR